MTTRASGTQPRPGVLFVCLGNICRSPLAEAAFRREAERIGLDVDIGSAGTGDWHIDKAPDPRAQAVARRNGIDISTYRARQVIREDFRRFTHIVALDPSNLSSIRALRPSDADVEVSLLMDHVEGRKGEPVTDPYYGDDKGFDTTWNDVSAGARGLARKLCDRQ
jgi:protein-tyrosine phosphatase